MRTSKHVFTPEEKHALAEALTDVMVRFEGSEAFREVARVLIEELKGIIAARAAKWNMQQCHCPMHSPAPNRSVCRL